VRGPRGEPVCSRATSTCLGVESDEGRDLIKWPSKDVKLTVYLLGFDDEIVQDPLGEAARIVRRYQLDAVDRKWTACTNGDL
jgi:hypothetical protein